MKYQEVLRRVYSGDFSRVPERLLCLDPGETTGWALFEKGYLKNYGQEETVTLDPSSTAKKGDKIIDWIALEDLFVRTRPTHVICENYRIYAHKLERHSFSDVQTLRLIGGIDQLCHTGWFNKEYPDSSHDCEIDKVRVNEYYPPISINYQMAVQAKGFATDERLKEWDFWKEGMRHSRDAIRHGLYFLIITNRGK